MARAVRLCVHCGKPVRDLKPGRRSKVAPFLTEIRARRAAGESLKVLADEFDVDPSYICKLTRGRLKPGVRSKFTSAACVELRTRRAAGESLEVLCKEFKISRSYLYKLTRGGRVLASETDRYDEE